MHWRSSPSACSPARPSSCTRWCEEVTFKAVKTLALVTTTMLLINATAVWLVLAVEGLPQILAVFHGILAVIMLMRIGMITKGGVTKT